MIMDNETSLKSVYCIEVRFDFTGTRKEVQAHAANVAQQVGGYVTAIFDENWDELDV